MKKFLVFLLLSVFTTIAYAQHSVQGKVLDKKDEGAIEAATIRLLNARDSSLVQGCFTDSRGQFTLGKIKNGNYILQVRFLGYKITNRNFTLADKGVILKTIYLEESEKLLQAVEVTGMTAQMAVKGDTIEYNPAAFKTAENAVVEDLLKKLPGVVVDSDGKITVNGEEIKKVRVDGKKFFGDDVQMATKNIPVDMVDKVQVVDQKSEMSQLTGFEDDNTERIINLTIKANRKKGIFGNVTAGGGMDKDKDFRYDTNTFLNIMSGESQTAVIAGANNVNTQRSGRGRGGMSGGGAGGITETQNIGLNNNTEVSKTFKVGGNGSFNHTTNNSESTSEKESYIDSTTYNTNTNSSSVRENSQANLRLEMEWNIDTLTTLIVQPEINYTKSHSFSDGDNAYLAAGDSISWGNSWSDNTTDAFDGSLRFIFSRKSAVKKGRTFTVNVGGTLSNSSSDGHNYSLKKSLVDNDSTIDQQTESDSKSFSADFRASFVEPLWNVRNFLEVATTFRANIRTSDQMKYNDLDGDKDYTDLDTYYSNSFENTFFNEALEFNFRHQAQSYNYMLGVKAEPSQTYSKTYYLNQDTINRQNIVVNYAPTASFRYNFGRKKFARLEYRGRTNQPSIEQMQPVKSNNLTNETIGNASLNPSFEHSLRLMYSSFNQERYSSFSAGLNGTYTRDALVTNSIYDATGKQYSQTVNSESAPFSGSANIMFNTPIIKNRLQFNTRTELSYQQRFGYSDRDTLDPYDADGDLRLGKLSKTASGGASENLSLTFTTDAVEIGLRGTARYNNTQNNLNANKNQETMDYTCSTNLNLHLPYNLTVSNDLSYTTREGYSSFTQDEWVWNASIDKSVFNKKGTLSLKLYDILQQKLNIRESIGDNYRTLSRSNMLTSYFILSFTYKIAKFGGGASESDMFQNRRGGFGGGPGRMGGGGFGGGPGM
jgi:hypothetical protein